MQYLTCHFPCCQQWREANRPPLHCVPTRHSPTVSIFEKRGVKITVTTNFIRTPSRSLAQRSLLNEKRKYIGYTWVRLVHAGLRSFQWKNRSVVRLQLLRTAPFNANSTWETRKTENLVKDDVIQAYLRITGVKIGLATGSRSGSKGTKEK